MSDDPEDDLGQETPEEEPKNKGGRPPHEPTPRTRAQVQVMHANGIPHRIIAKMIGIQRTTLVRHYREDLKDAALQVEASMGAAIVAAGRQGSWGAAKYWLLVNSKDPRWKTPEPHSISGNPDQPPIRLELADMTDDDIRTELDEIRSRQRAADGTGTMASEVPPRSNGMDH